MIDYIIKRASCSCQALSHCNPMRMSLPLHTCGHGLWAPCPGSPGGGEDGLQPSPAQQPHLLHLVLEGTEHRDLSVSLSTSGVLHTQQRHAPSANFLIRSSRQKLGPRRQGSRDLNPEGLSQGVGPDARPDTLVSAQKPGRQICGVPGVSFHPRGPCKSLWTHGDLPAHSRCLPRRHKGPGSSPHLINPEANSSGPSSSE